MRRPRLLIASIIGTLCLVLSPAGAPAAVIELGGSGWTASWDSQLHPDLSLRVDYVDQDIVVIEKFARFLNAPVNGEFETVAITFQQTRLTAAAYIVINDEVVENLTGQEWTGFIMAIEGDGVRFDVARTNIGADGGFSILPFKHFEYSNDDKTLTLGDGTVSHVAPATNLWMPGMASGALWIAAAPTATEPFGAFTLTEQPLPEPATLLGSLLLGAWMLLHRRP